MQKVRVKEVKIEPGKTGDKEWTKVTITGEDGSQFTTFDTKAEGLRGALIELEPIVKGKYINFEKWKVLEESTVAPTHESKGNGFKRDTDAIRLEYGFKLTLEKEKAKSVEAQVKLKDTGLYVVSGKAPDNIVKKYNEVLDKGLDYFLTSPEPKPDTVKEKAKEATKGPETAPPKNVGELFKFANDNGVPRSKVMEILDVTEEDLPKLNLDDSYQVIVEYIKKEG